MCDVCVMCVFYFECLSVLSLCVCVMCDVCFCVGLKKKTKTVMKNYVLKSFFFPSFFFVNLISSHKCDV